MPGTMLPKKIGIICVDITYTEGFPGGSAGKNPPAIQETLVQFLGWKDPLKKGWATHSSILGLPRWLRR